VCDALSFRAAERLRQRDFLRFLTKGRYKAPSGMGVRALLMEMSKQIDEVKEELYCKSLGTLLFDGAGGKKHENWFSAWFQSAVGRVLVDLWDCKHDTTDAKYIAGKIADVAGQVGASNVVAVPSDNASVMYSAYLETVKQEGLQHLAWSPCGGHMGGRIVADVLIVCPWVKKAAREANRIASFFRRKKIAGAYLKAQLSAAKRRGELKGVKHHCLKRIRETRFCSQQKCLESVRQLRSLLQSITMQEGRVLPAFRSVCGKYAKDIKRRDRILALIHDDVAADARRKAEEILRPCTVFSRHVGAVNLFFSYGSGDVCVCAYLRIYVYTCIGGRFWDQTSECKFKSTAPGLMMSRNRAYRTRCRVGTS